MLIVFMDVALLVIEYGGRHVFSQALKGVVYSVKLKMEFAILSKLVALSTRNGNSGGSTFTGAFEDYNGTVSSSANSRSLRRTRSSFAPNSSKALALSENPQMDMEKGDIAYAERVSGSADGATLEDNALARHTTTSTIARTITTDEQRRRRTIDEDLYASAMRGLSG